MKIYKIADKLSKSNRNVCPRCKQTLLPDEIGDAFCENCKIRATFDSQGYCIGIKPIDWSDEEWESYKNYNQKIRIKI